MKTKEVGKQMEKTFSKLNTILVVGSLIAMGAEGGIASARYSYSWFSLLFLYLWAVLFFVIHIVLHEVGHFIAGKVSGYSFAMFRLFKWTWVKENGKVVLRHQVSQNLAGQCLMVPPQEETYPPFKLYHLGGILMNLFVATCAFGVRMMVSTPMIGSLFMVIQWVGIMFAVMNVIPQGPNDGMNLWKSLSSLEEQRTLAAVLRIYSEMAQGKAIEELMPLIEKNETAPATTPNNTTMLSLQSQNYAYKQEFEEAIECLHPLWEGYEELVLVHKIEVANQLLFYLLMVQPKDERVEAIFEKEEYKTIEKGKESDQKRTMALVE